jgi:hypothetical protein
MAKKKKHVCVENGGCKSSDCDVLLGDNVNTMAEGPQFVTCPECGNEQGDMGRNVACDNCGFGPMPSASYGKDKNVEPPTEYAKVSWDPQYTEWKITPIVKKRKPLTKNEKAKLKSKLKK